MSELIFTLAEGLVKKVGSHDPYEALDYLRVKVKTTSRHPADGLKGFCTVALQTKFVMINSNLEEDDQTMVAGIFNTVRDLQSWKAKSSILLSVSGSSIDIKLSHP